MRVLITNDDDVILDSYVIVEYLNELAGGSLIPDYGPRRWKAKTNHSLINGMLDSMLLCRYEKMVRPQGLQWQAWSDDHWNRAWTGMARFENMPDVLNGPESTSSRCSNRAIPARARFQWSSYQACHCKPCGRTIFS